MKNFSVKKSDDRATVSTESVGAYYVMKTRIIRCYRWGQDSVLKTGAEAHAAMLKFLENRKDANELFVNLVEFES